MNTHKDFQLRDILWYKIGGTVKYFLECKSKEDILQALEFVKKNAVSKVFIVGLGSNLIFTDEYFDGAVIGITSSRHPERSEGSFNQKDSSAPPQNDIKITSDGLVDAYAGELFDNVITFSFENGLTGLEWAGGLPGTLGAAVRGNVGAYGGEIKDSLVSADVLDFSGDRPTLKTFTNEDLAFSYRESAIKKQKYMIVVSATFRLKQATEEEINAAKAVYEKNIQTRKDRHPLEYPNCGSVFKNLRESEKIEKVLAVYPELKEDVEKKWYGKIAVASLIEKLGLKGFQIGDAKVSEKHALFIVNLGHAKAKDVLQVIDTIQKKFQDKFGFTLETEVEIVK